LTDIKGDEILDENGDGLYIDVPSVAIWIPESIGRDIIRQPDNTV